MDKVEIILYLSVFLCFLAGIALVLARWIEKLIDCVKTLRNRQREVHTCIRCGKIPKILDPIEPHKYWIIFCSCSKATGVIKSTKERAIRQWNREN